MPHWGWTSGSSSPSALPSAAMSSSGLCISWSSASAGSLSDSGAVGLRYLPEMGEPSWVKMVWEIVRTLWHYVWIHAVNTRQISCLCK
jgi:hypothetical protein